MSESTEDNDAVVVIEESTLVERTAEETQDKNESAPSSSFVERVSTYAVVNAISKAYTTSKDSNRFLRAGAERMENSVKFMTAPFEPHLREWDQYAGKQLDYLERSLPSYQRILERTLQGLTNAEAYIDMLRGKLRDALTAAQENGGTQLGSWSESIVARKDVASAQIRKLCDNIHREIVQTLRNIVFMIDSMGSVLPIPGQIKLKEFLLSLPERFGNAAAATKSENEHSREGVDPVADEREQSSETIDLANDSVLVIKSLSNLIGQYLSWYAPLEVKSSELKSD